MKESRSQAAMDDQGYNKGLEMRTLTQQGSKHWHFPKRGSRVTFTNDLNIPTTANQSFALLSTACPDEGCAVDMKCIWECTWPHQA